MGNRLEINRAFNFGYFFSDPRISFKAKGILWFMLNPPEEWDHTIGGLRKFSADGLTAITSGVNELKKLGYLEARQKRNAGGYGESEYIIHDIPLKDKEA